MPSFVRSDQLVLVTTASGKVHNGLVKLDAADVVILTTINRHGGGSPAAATSTRCSRARCRSCRPVWTRCRPSRNWLTWSPF